MSLKVLDKLAADGEEITVPSVARAAGVHRSLIHRHDDLILDLCAELAERDEDLAAARAANRELMAQLNR
ncbi:hypothetical protein [Streptomyces sp. LN549]|uniref:hypothetical protein n=1 Tax=Streptomyces sp. LN549 TaxID=3112979 RepID=UPI003719B17D